MCNQASATDQLQCLELPSKTLKEHFSGCRIHTDSRDMKCVAAIDRYCKAVRFKMIKDMYIPLVGVSRHEEYNKIEISCIHLTHSGWVDVSQLKAFNDHCASLDELQTSHCLNAVHGYCNSRDTAQGGLSVGRTGEQSRYACFKSTANVNVDIEYLKAMNSLCDSSNSASSSCFDAACKWCESKGHSGGLTQGNSNTSVKVSCYKHVFHKVVAVQKQN